jgi:hypothetical protein
MEHSEHVPVALLCSATVANGRSTGDDRQSAAELLIARISISHLTVPVILNHGTRPTSVANHEETIR